ncbi:class I SAM-dependent methyltransferase [Bacteriovoracaceae bacterium]|nr:class I SAM-dependent methyltransferase [Bacteriovoracaceae bacterium]
MTTESYQLYPINMKDTLLDQYKKQWKWKNWSSLYDLLPNISDSIVYDIGCAHGDHSEILSNRGATVIGLDDNQDLLNYAEQRNISRASFLNCDIGEIDKINLTLGDGAWMSFVAAYFTDFKNQLDKISNILKPGGWIAVTEVDRFLDHSPLSEKYQKRIIEFYNHMYQNEIYDFNSGSKLKNDLIESNYEIHREAFLEDDELSHQGACSSEVVEAWKNRLARMGGFQKFLGSEYPDFENNFINGLLDLDHCSSCKVYFYLAIKR